jgi:aerobic carbon-monoxide dehydrogenase medium subunit
MKPAPLEYLAARSVGEAIGVLDADDDAKVIAGGQSLIPLLALRLARPTILVDINGLGLDTLSVDQVSPGTVSPDHPVLRLGALVRHRRLELDPVVAQVAPVLTDAAALIGHPAIRNRGSIGGSVAHADPAAELPAALVAASASVVVEGTNGPRRIAAADLFTGLFATALAADEIILEVRVPLVTEGRGGGAFCEWAPRWGDFADAGVGVVLTVTPGGECSSVSAAAAGIGAAPVSLTEALASVGLVGATALSYTLLRAVAATVRAACAGAGEDRGTLAGLLATRAVVRAHRRATTPVASAA